MTAGFLDADPGYAALLSALPQYAFAFILVLGRVGAAATLLPGIGEGDIPAVVRAGVAVAMCLLLTPVVLPAIPHAPPDAGRLAQLVFTEVAVGLWLGWLARMVALALPIAGQIASYMVGLASVLQTDPVLGAQTTALARLFSLAAPVLLLASGLYALPLEALAGSYDLFRPGAPLAGGDLARFAAEALAGSFALALQLASPFVLVSVVWQVAAGLVARLVPRLQVHFALISGQLLLGLILLAALSGAVVTAWQDGVRDGFAHLPGGS